MERAHVLIVEDDADINAIVAEHLGKRGYACTQAFSGSEARLLLDGSVPRASFDVVICDLMLPGMPGEDLVRLIRAHDTATPIIVTSARTAPTDKIDLLRLGADDYLAKPFNLNELTARIEVQLRHRETLRAASSYAPSQTPTQAHTRAHTPAVSPVPQADAPHALSCTASMGTHHHAPTVPPAEHATEDVSRETSDFERHARGGEAAIGTCKLDACETPTRASSQHAVVHGSATTSTFETPSSSTVLRFRAWELDPQARTLRAAGHIVPLTRTEFNIVEVLMRSPQRVFTKQALFEAAWGTPASLSGSDESTVSTHVSNIRGKLRASGTDAYIKTVWGMGFKLIEP